jgi:formylglycine-generating enzyme required for sulfatase activity
MKRRVFIKYILGSSSLIGLHPMFSSMKETEKQSYLQPDFSKMDIIPVPDSPNEWESFRKSLLKWKLEARRKINQDDSLYQAPAFKWSSSAYNCYFLMMYDELFYNHQTNQYTLDKFLDQAIRDFGRLDIVVLWHAYPRIGLDDRNQFDFYRDMPGGLEEIKRISRYFHDKNTKVFINYNPWDTGTRRENGSDIESLVSIIESIDADGLFLDTMPKASTGFREKLDEIKAGIVLESELSLPLMNIKDHHLSWAQWFDDSQAPGILRNKWFEQRHIQHGISRWNLDRTKELHTAWMNGSGILIWENVFGQWLGWNKRDKSILRAISPIQKRYSNLFSEGDWIPMADAKPVESIYANLWIKENIRLWTLVNRSEKTVKGNLLRIDIKGDENYYDLIQGTKVKIQLSRNGKGILEGIIYPREVGCFIAINKQLEDADFLSFLSLQSGIYKKREEDQSYIQQTTQLKPLIKTVKQDQALPRMLVIPPVKKDMQISFRVREIGYYESLDVSFINSIYPPLHHLQMITKKIDIARFAIDEVPVTNKQFETFLKETNYQPAILLNFLKHWVNGIVPSGKDDHPVVYVDLNDARAYAHWAGKRLPTEEEWQFAAQGNSENKYPWGEEMDESKCNSGVEDTTPVYLYPEGKSSFGCYDMCGNVWEMTESEYDNRRNRFCILKGGSFYKAKGSDWYFDGGPLPVNFSAKQLLIYPGIDRCSTVGFRCAIDLI